MSSIVPVLFILAIAPVLGLVIALTGAVFGEEAVRGQLEREPDDECAGQIDAVDHVSVFPRQPHARHLVGSALRRRTGKALWGASVIFVGRTRRSRLGTFIPVAIH